MPLKAPSTAISAHEISATTTHATAPQLVAVMYSPGIRTPIADWQRVNRQEQRRRYFLEPLLGLTGGSLQGRRVLDLGCSAGFWYTSRSAPPAIR